MLVIRIAIIRIAAAGVEESRRTIWDGILLGGPAPCQAFYIDIYSCVDLHFRSGVRPEPGRGRLPVLSSQSSVVSSQ